MTITHQKKIRASIATEEGFEVWMKDNKGISKSDVSPAKWEELGTRFFPVYREQCEKKSSVTSSYNPYGLQEDMLMRPGTSFSEWLDENHGLDSEELSDEEFNQYYQEYKETQKMSAKMRRMINSSKSVKASKMTFSEWLWAEHGIDSEDAEDIPNDEFSNYIQEYRDEMSHGHTPVLECDSAKPVEVEATTYIDVNGVLGDPNEKYTDEELKEIYYEGKNIGDPVVEDYGSYDSWLNDTLQYLKVEEKKAKIDEPMYEDTEAMFYPELNYKIGLSELKEIYQDLIEIGDPVASDYDTFEGWLKDTIDSGYLREVKAAEEVEVEEKTEDDLDQVDQEFTSKDTSINSGKLPAIYSLVNFPSGSLVLDYGGGKYDNGVEFLKDKDVEGLVYDPFNRTQEHNRAVVRRIRQNGGADIVLNSNVLNVIKEPEARINVLKNIRKLVKPDGVVYITVYEGKGTGEGKQSQEDAYQLHKKTADYLDEIHTVFPDAERKGKLIIAHPVGDVTANQEILGSDNLAAEIYEMLDESGGYTDYNQKIEDVMEDFGLDRDTAESYVWNWASGLHRLETEEDEEYDEDGLYDVYPEDVVHLIRDIRECIDQPDGYELFYELEKRIVDEGLDNSILYDLAADFAWDDTLNRKVNELARADGREDLVNEDFIGSSTSCDVESSEKKLYHVEIGGWETVAVEAETPEEALEIVKRDHLTAADREELEDDPDYIWIYDEEEIESSTNINLPAYAVEWVTGYAGNGVNRTEVKYFRHEEQRDKFASELESKNAVGIKKFEVPDFYHTEESIEAGQLVDTPQEVIDDLLLILSDYGFVLDDRFEPNPGRTWMGEVHIQVINPDSWIDIEDEENVQENLRKYVTRDMRNKIHDLERGSNCPITWNFGVDENSHVTGGLDIMKQWVPDPDEDLVESVDAGEAIDSASYESRVPWNRYYNSELSREEYSLDSDSGSAFIRGFDNDGRWGYHATVDRSNGRRMSKTFYLDNSLDKAMKYCEDRLNILKDSESIESASYGGAYDIEDDMYFTKEEIMEFANMVCDSFNEWASPDVYDVEAVYFIEDQPNTLEMCITDGNYDLYATQRIDMRKIRVPNDLNKYAEIFKKQLQDAYEEYHDSEEIDWGESDFTASVECSVNDEDIKILMKAAADVNSLEDLEKVMGGLLSVDKELYRHFVEVGNTGEYSPAAVGKMISDALYWKMKDSEEVESACDVESSISPRKKEEFMKQLQDELYNKASEVMQSPEFGFDLSDIADYLVIEIEPVTNDYGDMIKAEVRAELSYDGMSDLAEALNPIVEKYDKYAYFDHLTGGIIDAYLQEPEVENNIDASEEILAEEIFYDDPIEEQKTYSVEFDTVVTVDDDGIMNPKDKDWSTEDLEDDEYNIKVDDGFDIADNILDLVVNNIPDNPGEYRISGIAKLKYELGPIYDGYSDPDRPGESGAHFYDTSEAESKYLEKGSWVENFQCEAE